VEDSHKYDTLKLDYQLCFPLYATAKEIIRKYKPFLEELDLTYTQYITMMVMWERKAINVKTLGECLYLDSGTMTPVLKKLEIKGYIQREKSFDDERVLNIILTKKGMQLQEKAIEIPEKMGNCIPLSSQEASELYRLLYKILGHKED